MKVSYLLLIILMTASTSSQAYATSKKSLPACPDSPNCVSSQTQDTDHYIAPFEIIGDPHKAWSALRNAVIGKGRMVIVHETPDSLAAEATSLVFRFIDDIDAILDIDARIIHIRSASRIGYSDLGVNRRRMEILRAELQKARLIK
ncbi:MAG: DUF1499 domain-containing protein [Methylococcaceae bacterium]|nr:DUF1499 domain-containing protein [Methylococcaceae bacterium]